MRRRDEAREALRYKNFGGRRLIYSEFNVDYSSKGTKCVKPTWDSM